mgnify:CR=1 FL=1
MQKALLILVILIVFTSATLFLAKSNPKNILSPISQIMEKTLEKYSFERLKNRIPQGGNIYIGKELKNGTGFSSHIFYFTTEGKKVSGMINIPTKAGAYPVLVLLRGFIDQQIYTTGDGTRRDGEIFAQNGFITLAPDFLGYGESASPSASPVEERLQTYTTILDLLAALPTLNQALTSITDIKIITDTDHVGIWAHSNGGQIALSILAISGKNYPTVLWAPVSKPFPYSVLYFTDEFDDHGKKLRKVIADFEHDYDSELYTFTNYIDWINTAIQLHQGSEDEAVPQKWSDQFVQALKEKEKDVTYFIYPGENHNFTQGSWLLNIERNINFYQKQFSKTPRN